MDFKKYNSIENHYRQKYIKSALATFQDIEKQEFIILEKLDGANIQLLFFPDGTYKVGKRTSWVEPNDNFYNIFAVLEKYRNILELFSIFAKTNGAYYRLYGELYGKGINKRIDYGDDKYIKFFDAEYKGHLATYLELENYFNKLGIGDCLVKNYGITSLEKALQFDTETVPNIEGVIIKPYSQNLFFKNGERFIIKKKKDSFEELKPIKKEPTEKHPYNLIFREYINKNRILSIFSKYGEIETPQQISQYIKYVLEDAKEDFLKDHDIYKLIPNLDKKEEREIFNVGARIPKLLNQFL